MLILRGVCGCFLGGALWGGDCALWFCLSLHVNGPGSWRIPLQISEFLSFLFPAAHFRFLTHSGAPRPSDSHPDCKNPLLPNYRFPGLPGFTLYSLKKSFWVAVTVPVFGDMSYGWL